MKKTSFWIILIAAVAVISAAAAIWLSHRNTEALIANVYLEGQCVRSIDLDAIKERETFTVEGPIGTNTIVAERGRICVVEAECPDQVCVHMGWLSKDDVMPIVCLPNKLVIRLENVPAAIDGTEIDGVAG